MARVLTCYYRPKPGGFCKRLFRAMNALLAQGHEVHYLAAAPFPVEHPHCRFHRFPWPAGHTEGLLFWAVFHLLAPCMLLLIGLRQRITHAFVFGPNYGFMVQPLRILKHVPVTLFLRADTLANHRIKGRAGWLLRLEKWIEGMAIAGVCLCGVSEVLVAGVVGRHRWLKPRHAGVLRNDLEVVMNDGVRRASAKPLRASCVGILELRKNQALIIRALSRLPADGLRVDLYGVGPDEAALKQLAERMGVIDRVNFMGWVDAETLWHNTDMLLFPSLHEGAPNAVLEALARDVPVLASDIPEHREILPGSALLPAHDEEAWVRCLRDILIDPAARLNELRSQQRAAAEELRFDWDARICDRILAGC